MRADSISVPPRSVRNQFNIDAYGSTSIEFKLKLTKYKFENKNFLSCDFFSSLGKAFI